MTDTKQNHTANMQPFSSLDQALHALYGSSVRRMRTSRIGGGDINDAFRLELNDNRVIFMKTNKKENMSFFTAEAAGLTAIAQTGSICTPHILGIGTDEDRGGFSFLLLEYIDSKRRENGYWEIFAQQLAQMHQADTSGFVSGGIYGFYDHNYIGAGRQINPAYDSWVCFFRDCRLEPQLRQAQGCLGSSGIKKAIRLLDQISHILTEPAYPSLLHGDLWAGNVITGSDGRAWLIDPAVSVGHAEADLAMTELFGGFPKEFYDAYEQAAPLQPGYSRRRDLYNLYHMLNHLNLFGRGYLGAVERMMAQYV